MYKNFNCELLGITGRQSEIIELALTYGFKGLDIDMDDFFKRCQRTSFENAARFLLSAKLKIGGFRIPVDLDADEDAFTAAVARLNPMAEIAGRLGVKYGYITLPNQTDRLPYHEYFEAIRQRIDQISEVLAKEEIAVALTFDPIVVEETKEFKFVRDVEGFLALVKSCKQVGIVLDTWAWFCGGGELQHLEQIGGERVKTVWLADCAEGVSPGSATYDDCLLPGTTGVIPNAAYVKRLVEARLSLPVSPRGKALDATITRDAFISAAQDGVNAVFAEAGLPTTVRKPELFAAPPTPAPASSS
ncbi:MAG: xylose isomerase [Pirellulaceae bacterium]|nr:MAG: xylose isomerase [Pirellulaceae bacterium]